MDGFDYETKNLERAEKLLRTILTNEVNTDIDTLLPVLGFSSSQEALAAADRFALQSKRISDNERRNAASDARQMLDILPKGALLAFERKLARRSAESSAD